MVNIKLIIGSTRPNRFGPTLAEWLMEVAAARSDARFELIDLAEVALPLLDEPQPAASGQYIQKHTKDWAARIAGSDGFVMVTPEYNHSYAPALKNALDYLYTEWHHKPVVFASYGMHAGGARAVEHLRSVVAQLKMFDLQEHVIVPNYFTQMDQAGTWQATDDQRKQANAMLDAIVFWTGQMKTARAALAAKA